VELAAVKGEKMLAELRICMTFTRTRPRLDGTSFWKVLPKFSALTARMDILHLEYRLRATECSALFLELD